MRRLTGRKLVPQRYWGTSAESDAAGEVIIDGGCPSPPVAEAAPAPPQARPRARARRRLPLAEPVGVETPGRMLIDPRRERARHLAALYALGGAVIGAAPIPSPDMPLLVSVESRLISDIARLYGVDGSQRAVAGVMPALGLAGYAMRFVARRGQRCAPLLGWLVNGMVAYAGVRLVGEAALRWCEARLRYE